tara:strand:- start:616 stop:1350 length:735 start_codon:yes stop_codon:yes gene_type:complete
VDPIFLTFASFGVFVFGISKGGVPGPVAMLAVPVMSFVMSPLQAAGILLPLLIIMDFSAIYLYWKKWVNHILKIIIPASIVGILFGTFTFKYTNEDQIRIMVGIISIIFVIVSFIQKSNFLLRPTKLKGYFWSSIAGYTSFLIHAGNPPMNFYMLPLKLDKISFIGTMTLAFLVINIVKLIPYYYVGLLGPSNLMVSLILLPLAFFSVLVGYFLQKKIPEKLFFNTVYILLFISGAKLIYDGII